MSIDSGRGRTTRKTITAVVQAGFGFPPALSLEAVRDGPILHLARSRGAFRVGMVATSERDTVLAESPDRLGTAVLFVEVDRRSGETLRVL